MDTMPLPRFRSPQDDPPLPSVPADEETISPRAGETMSPPDSPQPSPPDSDRPEPLPLSPATPAAARMRTSSAGDPRITGKLIGGLLALLVGTATALIARSGRTLRQPTRAQITDVAEPLGAILARHLPAELIGEDLADAATVAAAAHAYVLDGPVIERIPTATFEEFDR